MELSPLTTIYIEAGKSIHPQKIQNKVNELMLKYKRIFGWSYCQAIFSKTEDSKDSDSIYYCYDIEGVGHSDIALIAAVFKHKMEDK